MVDREVRYERDKSRVERDTGAQAWGIIAVLAVLALVGWGIWAATKDNAGTTGTTIIEDRNPDAIITPTRETIVVPGENPTTSNTYNTYNTNTTITGGGNTTGP